MRNIYMRIQVCQPDEFMLKKQRADEVEIFRGILFAIGTLKIIQINQQLQHAEVLIL